MYDSMTGWIRSRRSALIPTASGDAPILIPPTRWLPASNPNRPPLRYPGWGTRQSQRRPARRGDSTSVELPTLRIARLGRDAATAAVLDALALTGPMLAPTPLCDVRATEARGAWRHPSRS